MKNQWTIYFQGSVKIKISGKGIERFINECVRNEINIWDVSRHPDNIITCSLRVQDIKKIRKIVRKSECKISFIRGSGLPFLSIRAMRNSGFVIGTILCLMMLFILSNMVWGIQIEGAKPETEHIIRKELEAIGVETGKFQFLIEDVESIQKHLSENINNITWVGVELNGTTYHFQVVEKNQPKETEYFSPRHLIARKKAVITNLFVEEGQPIVAINDHVKQGDLLVSGVIGKEGQTEIVSARGKIMGETWYEGRVTVPLKTKFNVLTGNSKVIHYVKVFDWNIPIWGFGKNTFIQTQINIHERPFRFIKWTLPLGYQKKIMMESETVERVYTKEEAIKVGMNNGRNELRSRINEDAIIKGEKILHQAVENGKVKLSIHYQVIEEISIAQPIIQGD